MVFDPNKHAQSLPPPPLPGSVTVSGGPWTIGVDATNPSNCKNVTQDGSTPVTLENDGGLDWRNPTPIGQVKWTCGFAGGVFSLQAQEQGSQAVAQWIYNGSTTDPTGTYTTPETCTVPTTLAVVLNP